MTKEKNQKVHSHSFNKNAKISSFTPTFLKGYFAYKKSHPEVEF